jgi:mono/diheme cytochrome c family protein
MTGVTKSPFAGAGFWLVVTIFLSLPAVTTLAQEWTSIAGGDPVAGMELVESHCGRCHASGYSGLLVTQSSLTQADLADRVRDRQALLRALHFERHPTMPKVLLSEAETSNVLAYFAQLRSGEAMQPFPRSWTRETR